MNVSSQSMKLKEAVLGFQQQIEQQVDLAKPEQVSQWALQTREAFNRLESVVHAQQQRIHETLFSEIADQDSALNERVGELQQADAEVQELMEIVKAELIVVGMQATSEIETRIENQKPDNDHILDLIDRGTDLIHWIRDQEDSVTAWFAEAFVNTVDDASPPQCAAPEN